MPSGSRPGAAPGARATGGGSAPTSADPTPPGAGPAETARRALPPRTSPLGAGRASQNNPGPTGRELRSASLRTRRSTRSGAGGQGGKENGGAPVRVAGRSGGCGQPRAPAPPAPPRPVPLRRAPAPPPRGKRQPLPGRGGELPSRERSEQPPEGLGEKGSARPYLLGCAARVGLGVSRGAAAASGGGVEVPGVVLVHGPRSGRGSRVPAFPHRHPPLPRRLPAPFSLPTSSALAFRLPTLAAERGKKKK